MIRPVAILAVLALLWIAFVHPEQLVAFVAGFALGVAVVASLPRFVAWGQRIARDSRAAGGQGVRIQANATVPPALAELERLRVWTVAELERLGVEIPDLARLPITSLGRSREVIDALKRACFGKQFDRQAN